MSLVEVHAVITFLITVKLYKGAFFMSMSVTRRYQCIVIIAGIVMGIVFPFYSTLFVTIKEGKAVLFTFACMITGVILSFFFIFISKVFIFNEIKKVSLAIKDIAEKKGNLQSRLAMRKINCSGIKNCSNTQCSFYNRKDTCWNAFGKDVSTDTTGSGSSEKTRNCRHCIVMGKAVSDELDHLILWFNTFITTLSRMISDAYTVQSTLFNSTEEISEYFRKNMQESKNISNNFNDIVSITEKSFCNLTSISSSIEQMTGAVQSIADTIQQMSVTISEVSAQCQEETEVVASSQTCVKKARETVLTFDKSSQEIDTVLEMIRSIADHTNLLALNASIEAASAGEAGKGFAVVAYEVKELAKQTSQATVDINTHIDAIRNNASYVSSAIEEMASIIERFNVSSYALSTVMTGQETTIKEIAANAAGTSTAVKTVADTVSSMVEDTHTLSSMITHTNSTTLENMKTTEHISALSQQLQNLAMQLKKNLERFKL